MWRYQFDGIRFPRKQEALGVLLLGLQIAEGWCRKENMEDTNSTSSGWWLTYPSAKWWTSSVGMMTFPIYGKNVPNHQPAINLDTVGKTIINHPPVITIVMVGICSIPKWVDKPPTSHLFLTSTPGSWLEKNNASLVPLNSDGFLGIDHDFGRDFCALITIWKNLKRGNPMKSLGLTLQSVHDFSPQKWTIGQLGQQGQLEAYFTNQLTWARP